MHTTARAWVPEEKSKPVKQSLTTDSLQTSQNYIMTTLVTASVKMMTTMIQVAGTRKGKTAFTPVDKPGKLYILEGGVMKEDNAQMMHDQEKFATLHMTLPAKDQVASRLIHFGPSDIFSVRLNALMFETTASKENKIRTVRIGGQVELIQFVDDTPKPTAALEKGEKFAGLKMVDESMTAHDLEVVDVMKDTRTQIGVSFIKNVHNMFGHTTPIELTMPATLYRSKQRAEAVPCIPKVIEVITKKRPLSTEASDSKTPNKKPRKVVTLEDASEDSEDEDIDITKDGDRDAINVEGTPYVIMDFFSKILETALDITSTLPATERIEQTFKIMDKTIDFAKVMAAVIAASNGAAVSD
jgi:hypothetical protein